MYIHTHTHQLEARIVKIIFENKNKVGETVCMIL